MRFLTLASLVYAASAARRGADVPASSTPKLPFQHGLLQPWGYPYGWGLDMPEEPEMKQSKTDKVKQVKSVKKMKQDDVPRKTPGWFHSVEHPHWQAIDEAFDGLE